MSRDTRESTGFGAQDGVPSERAPRSGVRWKVMVVDDSEIVLKLTSAMLQAGGFDVTTCDSAAGVVLRVIAEKPDLVLVDLNLGEVSGDRVIASLKNSPRTAHVRACLYSAEEAPSVAEVVRRSRADGFIQKGADTEAFTRAVRRALAG